MKSCLIFDLDRTLVDSKKVTQKILEIFLEKYNIESKGIDDKELASYTIEEFSEKLVRMNNVERGYVMRLYKGMIYDLYKKVRIRGGGTLTELRDKGDRICVITNNSLLALDGVMSNPDNKDLKFDMVLGFEDLKAGEDKTNSINRIIDMFGEEYKYYYIGDHKRDIRFARAAGIVAVGITTGVFSKKELLDEGADYVISKIEEITGIL